MTTDEMSDALDIMLNSYNKQAEFGDGASKEDMTLDEYEKSIFLTQAQDMLVRSYTDKNLNSERKGVDESTRRQIDFSLLEKVKTLVPSATGIPFDDRGVIFKMPKREIFVSTVYNLDGDVAGKTVTSWLHTTGLKKFLQVHTGTNLDRIKDITFKFTETTSTENDMQYNLVEGRQATMEDASNMAILYNVKADPNVNSYGVKCISAADKLSAIEFPSYKFAFKSKNNDTFTLFVATDGTILAWGNTTNNVPDAFTTGQTFDVPVSSSIVNSITFKQPRESNVTDVFYILNESFNYDGKRYVIVPINHKEYDREMSKPYSQPLKKQAWRLFQNMNSGFDVDTELIPLWNLKDITKMRYKIRYIKRPNPIILQDLPDGLNIDGISVETPCELSETMHMDIVTRAFELAKQTRIGAAAQMEQMNQQARQQQRNQ